MTASLTWRGDKFLKAYEAAALEAVARAAAAGVSTVRKEMRSSSSPSTPGQAPGVDTGRLIAAVGDVSKQDVDEAIAGIGVNDPDLIERVMTLENGSRDGKILPRPVFGPAGLAQNKLLQAYIVQAVKRKI